MRCKEHSSHWCLGLAVLCGCRREEFGQNAEPTEIAEKKWDALKKLGEGDWIKVTNVKGKWSRVVGKVTGFEWEGSAGYRVPDSILLDWMGKDGNMEEGIVGVNETWVKVPTEEVEGEGQAVERGTRKQKRKEEGEEGEALGKSTGEKRVMKSKTAEERVRRSTRNQGKRKEREGAATPDSEHPEQAGAEDATRQNLTQRDRHERGEGSGDEGPSSREGAG